MNFIYLTIISMVFISAVFICLYLANIPIGKKILAFTLFCLFSIFTQTAFALGFGFFGGIETLIGYLIVLSACSLYLFSFLVLPKFNGKMIFKKGKIIEKSDPVYTSYDKETLKNIIEKAVRKTSISKSKTEKEKLKDGLAVDKALKLCEKLSKYPLIPSDKRALDLSKSVLVKAKTDNVKKDSVSDAVFILIKLSAKYSLPLPKDKSNPDKTAVNGLE